MKFISQDDKGNVTIQFTKAEWRQLQRRVRLNIAGSHPGGGWRVRILPERRRRERTGLESTASAVMNRKGG